ncbi:glutamate--cysteine ligase [Candidatus Liberibacter solanacearum CLso-ZC1]|uniref:Glutamate--cysteine ligase n=1 Tax=Liberibacter solanacearum (strain CLso-ZC1) TaxID=658172 RepID=E4UB68_LIBSC|nr:glutamate--cysteine ligase [Candidatus Liberibacter solanacearum]ADR52547.1 glutamate--cysteine ligase [Candidatus Liberibacter solanacearum CLso-ZC1]
MIRTLSSNTIITSTDDLVEYMASGVKSQQDFKIGTEHEHFVFSRSDHRPIPYRGEKGILNLLHKIQKTLGWKAIIDKGNLIGLINPANKAGISLEPGGQLEVSSDTLQNVHQIKEEIFYYIKVLKEATKDLDLGVLGIGFNPKWTLDEIPIMPKSRYKIMKEYMPQVGTQGLEMMFRTCTTQVSLDFCSEQDMATKLRVSLKLQPLATALFASSPFTEGRPNGFQSWRSEIWRHTDNNRTGILPFAFENNYGFEDYAQWALDIPMYYVLRDNEYHACTDINFRQFMNGALKGRVEQWHPTIGDWENHLSTLFPDVRLRNCLEMRGADASTSEKILAITAFWTGLLYDSSALQNADDLTSTWSFHDVNDLRNIVPSEGLNAKIDGQSLKSIAAQVLSFSQNGLKNRAKVNFQREDETIFLKPLEKIIHSDQSFSDEILTAYHGRWNNSVEPYFEEYAY